MLYKMTYLSICPAQGSLENERTIEEEKRKAYL